LKLPLYYKLDEPAQYSSTRTKTAYSPFDT
jgi:hypothetical protein